MAKVEDSVDSTTTETFEFDAIVGNKEFVSDETPGTRFGYTYMAKSDSSDICHMTISGLEPQDWKHPSIFPLFKDAKKFDILKRQVPVHTKVPAKEDESAMDTSDKDEKKDAKVANGDTKEKTTIVTENKIT